MYFKLCSWLLILEYFWVTQGVSQPEDQIFDNSILLHHRKKEKTEQNNKCVIKCISNYVVDY